MPENRLLAAVDLGSNSFRLLIARVEVSPQGNRVFPLESILDGVRLADGLRSDGTLDEASRQRALVALAAFGERLRSFSPERVRAVGTSTLRVARNAPRFLRTAEAALGVPIEVVSGLEEARLVYVGAAHSLPDDGETRLVVDIGGGSTECIVGVGAEALALESAGVGCVVLSNRRFADGRITDDAFDAAYYEARDGFAQTAASLRPHRWRYAVGTSGTAESLWQIARAHWSADALDRASLERTRAELVSRGDASSVQLAGLTPDRRPVLAGGLAVMTAVFDELRIDRMQFCGGALLQGVLHDLLDRDDDRDVRALTIRRMMRRHRVDVARARRVRDTALTLFDQVAPGAQEEVHERRRLLGWAAELAEIGRSVTHEDFHRHSAYLLAHAEMLGFSQSEQDRLALLALTQTGSLDALRAHADDEAGTLAALALRVATIVHLRRDASDAPAPTLSLSRGALRLQTTRAWAQRFPLAHQGLMAEARAWSQAGTFESFVYETIEAPTAGAS
ncbi:MAG: Ppx/GppA phosphatase family protein [Burkholderiaceae bacterium]|jgi:exopolyphosphatase/guanosine-5'-triphosphate,3'-diphosphate pyrophosphatase|nr:Ppx/GppA phosphatase family protein [Burkholderiaceae bacterium]